MIHTIYNTTHVFDTREIKESLVIKCHDITIVMKLISPQVTSDLAWLSWCSSRSQLSRQPSAFTGVRVRLVHDGSSLGSMNLAGNGRYVLLYMPSTPPHMCQSAGLPCHFNFTAWKKTRRGLDCGSADLTTRSMPSHEENLDEWWFLCLTDIFSTHHDLMSWTMLGYVYVSKVQIHSRKGNLYIIQRKSFFQKRNCPLKSLIKSIFKYLN